jgi:hypothetical protein
MSIKGCVAWPLGGVPPGMRALAAGAGSEPDAGGAEGVRTGGLGGVG